MKGLIWFIVLILVPLYAQAETPSANEILERMERTINGFEDQVMDVSMTVVDVDGSSKSYEFTIWQKGDKKRLVRFKSGEIKGMATLVEDRQHVYVYLPGLKKVRRVAAHNMNQSFAGSDMSHDDMAAVSWTALYNATLDHEDDGHWYLNCLPKPGVSAPYSRAVLKVAKETYLQMGIEYYDASGTKVKVWRSSDIKDFHGIKRGSVLEVIDARTGHKTILKVKDFRVNQNLPDSMFTQRELEWGS